jgi:hypothetical protein
VGVCMEPRGRWTEKVWKPLLYIENKTIFNLNFIKKHIIKSVHLSDHDFILSRKRTVQIT